MEGVEILDTSEDRTESGFSRRNFIKGVIAAGAAVSSTHYLFRGSGAVLAQASAPGAVERGMSRALLKLSGSLVHDYATISDDSPSPNRASRARRAATSAGIF